MEGVILIDKPKGYTSHDVVNILRKELQIKKVGHTGTLDPEATGVLPILVGEATKISKYLIIIFSFCWKFNRIVMQMIL